MDSIPSQVTDPLAAVGGSLERGSGRHLYEQLTERLREAIISGRIPEDASIPSQRALGRLWGVGEVTVRRAMQELAEEGLVESRVGRGTVVRGVEELPGRREATPLRIGVVFDDLADGYPFFPPLLAGLREGSRPPVVQLFDLPAGAGREQVRERVGSLAGYDGLVMMSPVNLSLAAAAQERGLPVVMLFNEVADGHSACVVPDYPGGVFQAVGHLVKRGKRRIGLVTPGAKRFSTGRWTDAYCLAVEAHGLIQDMGMVRHAGYGEAEGYEAMGDFLSFTDPPDGVILASDHLARGALLRAHEHGVSVPDEISIIGAGNVLGRMGWSVPLTTIDLGLRDMGRHARDLIRSWGTEEGRMGVRQVVWAYLLEGGT